jgi:pimeloyl-ACP methyl ester carboxylesterase
VAAVNDGYAAAVTDGGHTETNDREPTWALSSPGNVNFHAVQDFAAVSLSDMTLLGKAITESYYGKKPDYSYWYGCSTGGRQGMMLAQRYPELYDGIVANAPAINWDIVVPSLYWPQQVMNRLGVYPPQCELQAFTQAAIAACDEHDGLKDGIISDADACTFDPFSKVGQSFDCAGKNSTFTSEGATVAQAAWSGMVDDSGNKRWFGINKDAALVDTANTTTTANSSYGTPFDLADGWLTYFVAKDPAFDLANVTNAEFFDLVHQSQNQYSNIMGSSDPDLSAFKARNGKLLTWHGLADPLPQPNGTLDYYQRVSEKVDDVQDFYRFFEAPGVGHCMGGVGAQPVGDIEAMVKWVEEGIAPDTLPAVNATLYGEVPGPGQELPVRNLCAWPKKQTYNGGDPAAAESFDCV